MSTGAQRGLIHALAAKAGMDEDTRRAFMQRETGVTSTTAMTTRQAAAVIDKLKPLAGRSGAIPGLDSAPARKLRALWIAGYDLGLVRDRSDRAMLAFLERQTGVSHPRFLNEPGQATAAIEGLKSWLARAGKVTWPEAKADIAEVKRAVLEAQWFRLVEIGAVKPFIVERPLSDLSSYADRVVGKRGWCFYQDEDYDSVQRALGRKLRRELALRGADDAEASEP